MINKLEYKWKPGGGSNWKYHIQRGFLQYPYISDRDDLINHMIYGEAGSTDHIHYLDERNGANVWVNCVSEDQAICDKVKAVCADGCETCEGTSTNCKTCKSDEGYYLQGTNCNLCRLPNVLINWPTDPSKPRGGKYIDPNGPGGANAEDPNQINGEVLWEKPENPETLSYEKQ